LVVAVAAMALACCVIPSAGSKAPGMEELRKKSMKELWAMLRQKGANCKKCVEKDELVNKVIETWDWTPNEAASPDGQIKMDKETFVRQLKSSYESHFEDERKKRRKGGHELADSPLPEEVQPDFDKVWADFSSRLSSGDIQTDPDGKLHFDIDRLGEKTVWDRYKVHLMLFANMGLLILMQRLRRKDRQERRAGEEGKPVDNKPKICADKAEPVAPGEPAGDDEGKDADNDEGAGCGDASENSGARRRWRHLVLDGRAADGETAGSTS